MRIKKSRNDIDSKRIRKPPALFVLWKKVISMPIVFGKKKLQNKQEQKRLRILRKDKELAKEGRGTFHLEVKEDKDLFQQKGKPAKKTKETNCGKKGSSKGK